MMVETYDATCTHVAVEDRSWNGANCLNHVPDLQTVPTEPPPVMIFWPFLFCQKPIVNAPVLAGPQTSTVWLAVPVVPVVLLVNFAVFGYLTQLFAGTFTV